MTILEKKVDAIARSLLAVNPLAQGKALAELKELLAGNTPPGSVRGEIDRVLTQLGIPQHVVGYRHLQEAIRLCVEDGGMVHSITKRLYPEVAQICNTTAPRAERAIRHAIEISFDRCDADILDTYFGNTVSPERGKATNSEFIARISNVIRERIEGGVTHVLQNLSRLRSILRPLRAL